MSDFRLELASTWISSLAAFSDFEILPLAGDASFRRYFRMVCSETGNTYVLMDAPPEKEDIHPFLNISEWLKQSGLNPPEVLYRDLDQGFLLLQDFGDITWSLYLQNHQESAPLFEDALKQIHLLQQAAPIAQLPLFDVARMQREADLYLDWYLPHVKAYQPDHEDRQSFYTALMPVLEQVNHIPKAPVHLDYHSRNLMVPESGLPLGVIDFQDAVLGPVTYDLASLLYDCYQNYPESQRREWSRIFFEQFDHSTQAAFNHDFEEWHKALRLTALQRHIKAIGIFARLAHRDGKKQFLDEIPLTRQHLDDELQALSLDIPLLSKEPRPT